MTVTVLVVDDSPTLRRIVETALSHRGWSVWAAADGAEALARIGKEVKTPDLVITDWNMPELDGLGLLRALRADARFAAVPILILTTDTEESSKAAAREAGATGWLDKPVDVNLLHEVIDSLLA